MTIVLEVHPVVWATNGNEVANWELRVTGLYDVAANERTLSELRCAGVPRFQVWVGFTVFHVKNILVSCGLPVVSLRLTCPVG